MNTRAICLALTSALLALGSCKPPSSSCETDGDVLINEAMPNPDAAGGDDGAEWIELINVGDDEVDLSGWTLESFKSDPDDASKDVRIPDGTEIGPGEVLLIGEADVEPTPDVVVDLDLGNGSGADAIALVDCEDDVNDVLVYGDADNGDGMLDESGEAAVSVAVKPGEGIALARCPDGADTDASGDDFGPCAGGTPGESNEACCASSVCDTAADVTVTINEFMANPGSTDAGREWVELYNDGNVAVDLAGWVLESFKSSPDSAAGTVVLPAGAEIPAYGYLVIGGEDADAALDVVGDVDLGNGGGGDAVALRDCTDVGTVEDAVVYGDASNDDGMLDDSGSPASSVAPTPGEDEALARCPEDGADSGQSAIDFSLCADGGTPGEDNGACCGGGCNGADTVVIAINEILVNPGGSDEDHEWIELVNAGNGGADLSGWTLAWFKGDPDNASGTVSLPQGTVLAAGDFLLVGGPGVVGVDVEADLDLGNGSGGDAIHLSDCVGVFEDGVVYGPDNSHGMTNPPGFVATSIAEQPGEDESLARYPDGADSDQSGDDFFVCLTGTPGYANDDCSGGGGEGDLAADVLLVINEVLIDPSGTDAGYEWIEIYNAGIGAADVSGWEIAWYKGDPLTPSDTATLPAGQTIAGHDFLLVGDAAVAGSDVVATLDFGNGSTGDGIHLVDVAGTVEDALVYAPPNDHGILDEHGAVASSLAADPGGDETLARIPDGVDTDQSGADFAICAVSGGTPGLTNAACD